MKTSPILFLSAFLVLGCSRESKETIVFTFNSSDTPYETVTIRIQTATGTDSALMFPHGQVIGGTKTRINPRIRYRNGDEFVEVIIYSDDKQISKEFALKDGGGDFELPFGISMRVRK